MSVRTHSTDKNMQMQTCKLYRSVVQVADFLFFVVICLGIVCLGTVVVSFASFSIFLISFYHSNTLQNPLLPWFRPWHSPARTKQSSSLATKILLWMCSPAHGRGVTAGSAPTLEPSRTTSRATSMTPLSSDLNWKLMKHQLGPLLLLSCMIV